MSKKQSQLKSILEDDPDIEIPQAEADMISQAYYEEGATYGRDALYHYLKSKHKENVPSIRTVLRWLSRQRIHQEFGQTRRGGLSDYFKPVKPFHSLSIDLIDFNYKQANFKRYVLVVIDNFSRKMFTEALSSKKAEIAAKGMSKIFDQISAAHGVDTLKQIKYINSDDGSEFKGEFDILLKSMNPPIPRQRTLGGHPEQNGLVERANGKVKMLLAKQIKINGGNWNEHLQPCTQSYNNQLVRTTKYTPNEALNLREEDWNKLIENVAKEQTFSVVVQKDIFKVGDSVRIKLNKSSLGKSSTPSWSDKVHTVGRVIPSKNPQIADKYKVVGMAQDQSYCRNDLQKVNGQIEDIPKEHTEEQKREIISQLRLNEDSTVEGAFNVEALEKDKLEFDKDYPDEFAKGANLILEQNKKSKQESRLANAGPKVKLVLPYRQKSTRQTKQVKTLDPSLLKSDTQLRAVEKDKSFEVLYLIEEKNKGKKREYFVKWGDGAETWTNEWIRVGTGKKAKYERNISQSLIDDFEEAEEQLLREDFTPPSTPKSKTMTLNMTTPPKRRDGMSVKTPGTIKNNR